jgi:Na+/proline symporter
MARWLEIGAASFAFVAAIFWFLSAYGELPQMRTYWDATPANDPFFVAVRHSAVMNKWAAGFSGASALCAAVRFFL